MLWVMWSAARVDGLDLEGERIAMTATADKRRDDRISIRLEAFYSFGRVEDNGMLADISYSGALIEGTTMKPEIGTRVSLYVYLKPPSAFEATAPFELTGVISRHSSDGFAIEYEDNHGPDLRRMVDDAAALVATRR
jgi:hypothetical protein